jgi:RNA polymerase sigma-70 factor (ECF subfamily)
MLRITIAEDHRGTARLRVEGRITGETMGELSSVCESRLGEGQAVVLELGGVTYADAAGAGLLRGLEHRGAAIVGANGFVGELMRRSEAAPTAKRAGAARLVSSNGNVAKGEAAQAPPVDADEEALVARIRAGDQLACELVVRRFAARLLAVARRVLGNEDDAHDALQDAFLSAFRGIERFTGDARLSTWLHRIVVNAALMRLRSRRRRAEDSIDDLLPRFDDEGGWLEPPTSWRSEELLERDETRTQVRRAIEQLPARHREVLVLRDIEELDTGEVAGMLGISANAVKVRLHRARQALRTLIERDVVGSEARLAGAQPMGARA